MELEISNGKYKESKEVFVIKECGKYKVTDRKIGN